MRAGYTTAPGTDRPTVGGKFLFVGDRKLYLRGVTYGTLTPDERGEEFHDPAAVDRDFAQMAANGINTVRTYTTPPRWLLDCAQHHGMWVMAGLPWEQHVAFLEEGDRAHDIEERVRAGARTCSGHPALLALTLGNEIPASIVRWHGKEAVERFLERLYRAVKSEAPDTLVTYVNYPSTEYLELPFLDFMCVNVYLETQEKLESFLARLQNLAGEQPLVLGEVGIDSRRYGEEEQAAVLDWQIKTAFGAGCAGMFVFAWTDEWHRGGYPVEDWDFGLTDRARRPKPALRAVREAFSQMPFPAGLLWPPMSVVVCSHNGARTLGDTCEGLQGLNYPDYEVIVVDDGSTDATAHIAESYGFTVISTPNRGLSAARNTGMEAAMSRFVAYTDDDARPDEDWLRYLAMTFLRGNFGGVGGPNIAPPGDGPIADCVANSPGGPTHVLISDVEAEHIPGCNMAFQKDALLAVGGFDPRYRAAGDDVDVCWRLQEAGWPLGFSPAAMVWHHRRNSVRAYWRQQKGYGKAEALLEGKWPERYNSAGHLSWGGRIYGKGLTLPLPWGRSRIYSGPFGSAAFQSLYGPPSTPLELGLMPEWFLVCALLLGLTLLGASFRPLVWLLPLYLLAVTLPIAQAALSASRARFSSVPPPAHVPLGLRALTFCLHLMQPMARLWGRLEHGLHPWRLRGPVHPAVPMPLSWSVWSERWRDPESWIRTLEGEVRRNRTPVVVGDEWDRWDLEVRPGTWASGKILSAVEEHGDGKQMVRFKVWPRWSFGAILLATVFGALGCAAALSSAAVATAVLGSAALLVGGKLAFDGVAAMGAASAGLRHLKVEEPDVPTGDNQA